ncbi:MAG: hypothetical protein AAGF84_00490 [Planctomycetota bacterium]
MNRPPSRRVHRRSAGYALLLVLIAVAFASALGTAMVLTRGPAAALASNVRHTGDARALAEAALEIATDMAMRDNAFRSAYTNDVWSADQPFENGMFRVKFADPDDNDLADNVADPVRITVLANVEGRTHEVAALLSPAQPNFSIEVGKFTAGPTPTAISFQKSFNNPVVVCTPHNHNNVTDRPIVVRVQNVTSTGFEAYLQNPGDQSTPVADKVYFVAMEQGVHDFNGIKAEAWTIDADVTDRKGSANAIAANYLQAYTKPIVLGQVMTANDARWSNFWTRGNSRQAEPNSSTLRVGKNVGEDTDRERADETLGVIVIEAGVHDINGIKVQAFLSEDNVGGVTARGNRTYAINYPEAFDTTPKYAYVGSAGEDGGDMGIQILAGDNPFPNTTNLVAAIDEDTIRDTERSHTTERVFVLAFESNPAASSGAGLNVVMLVDDAADLDPEDAQRVALLQTFGMNVELLDASQDNAHRETQMLAADVVYISALANDNDFDHLIDDLATPFVSEHEDLIDDLGLATGIETTDNDDEVEILDNSHPITSGLTLGLDYAIFDSAQSLNRLQNVAPDAWILADRNDSGTNRPMLTALDFDGKRSTGSPSPSRRVQLPWGNSAFDPSALNAQGQELLRQSLVWAAGDPSGTSQWQSPPRLVWEEPDE